MAADEERSRKITDRGVKKLLPGEKVEILYSEEGLKGSWHLGVISECRVFSRTVELAHLLNEDSCSRLLNKIPVSAAIEGVQKFMSKLHRNSIRPLPPKQKMKETEFIYGLCVDVLVDDAWWEGVVFDHNVTSTRRLVFFPDQGDQQVASLENLRITQEWNEASGQWKLRGVWKFLQVIEEYEVTGPLPVSIREIWYDLRSLESFLGEIGVWISGSKCTWHDLVAELLEELQSVVNGHPVEVPISCVELCENPINSINFPLDNGGIVFGSELLNPNDQSSYYNTPFCGNNVSKSLFFDGMQDSTIEVCKKQATPLSSGHDLNLSSPNAEEQCNYGMKNAFFDTVHCDSNGKVLNGCQNMTLASHLDWSSISNNFASQNSASGITDSGFWQVMDFGAENCAEAIPLYLHDSKHGNKEITKKLFFKRLNSLRLKVKRHLIALGWNILTRREGGKIRIRFVSPNGRCYNSLRSACLGVLCVKPKRKGKKKWNKLKSLDGFHFVSYYKIGSMSFRNESTNEICSSNPNELENGYTKSRLNLQRSCSLPRKQTSNALLNSSFNDKSGCDIVDEVDVKNNSSSAEKQDLVLIDSKGFPMQKDIEPEHCPAALAQFLSYKNFRSKSAKKRSAMFSKPNKSKVRKHLLSKGWKLWRTKYVYYYVSPSGDTFHSLFSACKASLEEEINPVGTSRPAMNEKIRRRLEYLSKEAKPVNLGKKHWRRVCRCATTMADENLNEELKVLQNGAEKKCTDSSKSSESTACNFSQMLSNESRGSKKRKITSSLCLRTDQKLFRHSGSCTSACAKSERRKPLPDVIEKRASSSSCRRSSKRSREVDALSSSQHASRTVLSLLVENDVVLPRQKVKYLGKKDGRILKEGRITRDGIKCKCCSKVLSISDFEVHAGSTLRRPAANIFLKDGRSLLQCQIQMFNTKVSEGFKRPRIKSDNSNYQSDSICSVCHDGGSLILCDQCPASFHLDCVGLMEVPEDNWFCPYCRCHACGTSEFNPDSEKFTDKTVLYCDQCEHEYHVGCMKQRGWKNLQSCPPGNWFCSGNCAKIYHNLQKLLGKSKPTALEGLSCTILRSGRDFKAGCDNIEVQAEHHSKLCVSLRVLHECFVAIIEPRTQSDLVSDILFNKESELKRLNFYGFYTMLLEKGDEMISVATFRIYGEKIAEMPLIGTRIKYRRQGMCRLLVREIEKLLISIGVERFILPAVPQLLETWTTSFGFTEMSGADRVKYADYTVLNFQDTTMCQKILKVAPVAEPKLKDNISKMDSDHGSQASKLVLALPCFVTNPLPERPHR